MPADSFSEETSAVFSGHYRNLLICSKTQAEKDSYYLDSNRLRLELRGEPAETFSYDIQYDNHVAFGDYISTSEFASLETAAELSPRRTYWDLDQEISERGELRWEHSVYRAYATFRSGNIDLTVGRQRIPWGKGWFWSPLDIFNPVSPTAIERDEREGVDGALLTVSKGTVSSASLVYLPRRAGSDTVAGRVVGSIGSYDVALSGGTRLGRDFAGIDFAGYIGDGGLYGEVASIDNEEGSGQVSLLISGNYNFESSLYIMIEYFHNGGGTAFASGIDFKGENYIGFQAGYDLTPLTRWDNYIIVNWSDGSLFYSPVVTSSLKENLDLGVGLQLFEGDDGDEFGTPTNVYYADFSWYF